MVIVMEQSALSARRRRFIAARAGLLRTSTTWSRASATSLPLGRHFREGGILMDAPRRGRVCIPMLPWTPSIGMN
jgi:hypothetical protein